MSLISLSSSATIMEKQMGSLRGVNPPPFKKTCAPIGRSPQMNVDRVQKSAVVETKEEK